LKVAFRPIKNGKKIKKNSPLAVKNLQSPKKGEKNTKKFKNVAKP
jgi:hypothetical protein